MPPATNPFSILLCLKLDDFTCQGEAPAGKGLNTGNRKGKFLNEVEKMQSCYKAMVHTIENAQIFYPINCTKPLKSCLTIILGIVRF